MGPAAILTLGEEPPGVQDGHGVEPQQRGLEQTPQREPHLAVAPSYQRSPSDLSRPIGRRGGFGSLSPGIPSEFADQFDVPGQFDEQIDGGDSNLKCRASFATGSGGVWRESRPCGARRQEAEAQGTHRCEASGRALSTAAAAAAVRRASDQHTTAACVAMCCPCAHPPVCASFPSCWAAAPPER